MISGASQMDGAIIVVAATDGQMPQTREHLLMAKQTGVQKIVIFVNKVDLVEHDVLELVEIEMRELLCEYGFDGDNAPVIYGSALLALNGDQSEFGEPSIHRLIKALDDYIPTPQRDLSAPFLLPIDNIFSVPNRGTVIVGTLSRGVINKKDECDILGYGKKLQTVIKDLHVFGESVPSVIHYINDHFFNYLNDYRLIVRPHHFSMDSILSSPYIYTTYFSFQLNFSVGKGW